MTRSSARRRGTVVAVAGNDQIRAAGGNDLVCAVIRGERNGKKLEDKYTHVAHFRDGKIAESWLHQEDLYAVDEFFS